MAIISTPITVRQDEAQVNPVVITGTISTGLIQGLTDTQLRTSDVKITLDGETVPVTGTFWQATQPISVASLPLPSNAAQETGGNLAAILAKIISAPATAANQTNNAQKTQLVDSGGNAVTVTGNKLDVNATVSTVGLATEAKQDVEIATLGNIETAITGTLSVALDNATFIGQDTMANSLPVVIASNQTAIPVSGTVVVDTSLLATAAKQDSQTSLLTTIDGDTSNLDVALSTRLKPADTLAAVTTIGTITNVVHVDDNGGSLTIDGTVALGAGAAVIGYVITDIGSTTAVTGTVAISAATLPLPTLASTSTKQSDGSQKAQIVDGSGNVIGSTSNALDINIKSGNPTTIAVTNAGTFATQATLQTGSAIIGRVGVDQTTPGTTNKVTLGADVVHTIVDSATLGTVAISAVALPLPSGAATAALQTQPGVDIGDVTINNAAGVSAVNIQDGGNSITIDGSITANAGTNLNTSALALESGGNLASLVAKDFATQTTLAAVLAKILAAPATEAKQDTGNASLASIAAEDFSTETTLALLYALLNVAQGADGSSTAGPMVQGLVNDVPSSFLSGNIQPLSLTSEGRLRVSTVPSDIQNIWRGTFNSPWFEEELYPTKNNYFNT